MTEIDPLLGRYKDVAIHIIPGNHDDFLSKRYFSSSLTNVFVYEEPTVKIINDVAFAFIPYRDRSSFEEEFSRIKNLIPEKQKWVLVSHSDIVAECYGAGSEKKAYFPLTRKDLSLMRPSLTILGHIHQPPKGPIYNNVFYTGSPCACDTNETGARSYIMLDLANPLIPENVMRHKIQRGMIFHIRDLVMLPVKDEAKLIEDRLKILLYDMAIDIDPANMDTPLVKHKACVTINVKGISYEGKEFVEKKIREHLEGKILDELIIIDSLKVCAGQDMSLIAQEVHDEINNTFYSANGRFKGYKDTPAYGVTPEDEAALLTKALEIIAED